MWIAWCIHFSPFFTITLSKRFSGISDAYYCAECTRLEKDRDGCPKIVNLGASRTDLFYERRRLGEFHSFPHVLSVFLTHELSTRIQEGVGMLMQYNM